MYLLFKFSVKKIEFSVNVERQVQFDYLFIKFTNPFLKCDNSTQQAL